jgi:hypothetical protein
MGLSPEMLSFSDGCIPYTPGRAGATQFGPGRGWVALAEAWWAFAENELIPVA